MFRSNFIVWTKVNTMLIFLMDLIRSRIKLLLMSKKLKLCPRNGLSVEKCYLMRMLVSNSFTQALVLNNVDFD
nr:hypothetical protein [Dinophyceae sp. MRD-151]